VGGYFEKTNEISYTDITNNHKMAQILARILKLPFKSKLFSGEFNFGEYLKIE
jgi:hypothetical protein